MVVVGKKQAEQKQKNGEKKHSALSRYADWSRDDEESLSVDE